MLEKILDKFSEVIIIGSIIAAVLCVITVISIKKQFDNEVKLAYIDAKYDVIKYGKENNVNVDDELEYIESVYEWYNSAGN